VLSSSRGDATRVSITYTISGGMGATKPMSEAEAIIRHSQLVLAGASRIEMRDVRLHLVTLPQLVAMEAGAGYKVPGVWPDERPAPIKVAGSLRRQVAPARVVRPFE
jgi:hypothetical protein